MSLLIKMIVNLIKNYQLTIKQFIISLFHKFIIKINIISLLNIFDYLRI
jgi:hypothetical protein